jgi:2-C-methyl-D-erythritol 4-phosphate cytidylyltransferase
MPAAGSGSRLGAPLPKALVELAGKPLFGWAVMPVIEHEDCSEAVIAVPESEPDTFTALVGKYFKGKNIRIISGGEQRQDSVRLALKALKSEAEVILVHDAARPLISRGLIDQVLSALNSADAVVPVLPIATTVKELRGQPPEVYTTLDRSRLVAAETPQGIRRGLFLRAHDLAERDKFVGTDDVSLIEHFHLGKVNVVDGDPRTIKITTQHDLNFATWLLSPDLHSS